MCRRVRQSLILAAACLAGLSSAAAARGAAAPPSFAAAASRGIAELVTTHDHTAFSWNPKSGLWGRGSEPDWWQSALAVTTLMRYAERTRSVSPVYQRVLLGVYKRNVHNKARPNFINQFLDDTAWWGLAWLEASRYDLYYRGDRRDAGKFLAVAEWDAGYIASQRRPCGGIEWQIGWPPNTITNAQFVALAAELHTFRATPGPFYSPAKASGWLTEAADALSWLEDSGLVNLQAGSVLDSLNHPCHVIGGSLTYTEGEIAEALTQMGIALKDPSYFAQAAPFFRYTASPVSGLTANGILQEHCESVRGGCDSQHHRFDVPAYKGLFVNALADWTAATHSGEFNAFLRAQATAVVSNAIRGPNNNLARCATPRTCQFAFHWTGEPDPAPLGPTLGSQESGLDALTAVLPRRG